MQKISSISMLVMSSVFTISAWLVNFTYFAYLQFLHILTFAFSSKIIVRSITFAGYIQDHIQTNFTQGKYYFLRKIL